MDGRHSFFLRLDKGTSAATTRALGARIIGVIVINTNWGLFRPVRIRTSHATLWG